MRGKNTIFSFFLSCVEILMIFQYLTKPFKKEIPSHASLSRWWLINYVQIHRSFFHILPLMIDEQWTVFNNNEFQTFKINHTDTINIWKITSAKLFYFFFVSAQHHIYTLHCFVNNVFIFNSIEELLHTSYDTLQDSFKVIRLNPCWWRKRIFFLNSQNTYSAC